MRLNGINVCQELLIKNATVKNFTSTDFLGSIRFDSPIGGGGHPIRKYINMNFT